MPYQVRVSRKISGMASVKDQSVTGSRTVSPESQRPGRRSCGAQADSEQRHQQTGRPGIGVTACMRFTTSVPRGRVMLPDRMAWVAGADGCKRGWIRASRETASGELRFDVCAEARELLRAAPSPRVLGIDIPIGLPERGARACDLEARALLGARRSSVFPAPIRPALPAGTREEASLVTARLDGGRRVSTQAWGIYPKIRALDSAARAERRGARAHSRGAPGGLLLGLERRRADARGQEDAGRNAPAPRAGGEVARRRRAGARARRLRARDVADDDILDAIAALWTATRIAQGRARTLPETPLADARGLRMEIVY